MGRKNKVDKGASRAQANKSEDSRHGKDIPVSKLKPERLETPVVFSLSGGSDKGTRSTIQQEHGKKFLTPQDGELYQDLVKNHYQGFVHIPVDEIRPSNFHQTAKVAFERLRDSGYYQYDIVKAGGQHASRTFVKRTLVGEPGITYKYLGLRLFAHAWSGPGVLPVMKTIGELNQHMINMTKHHKIMGRCDYNLTLINFMEPSSHSKVGFKDEAFYGMGKVSVSWHADSSLESNSSIGVYHCLPSQKSTKWDWRIGLRPIPDNKDEKTNDITPIVTSTKDGDIYFLLGKFNETHQHCVLSGSECNRISSTHRVAVTKEDTYDYIRQRTKGALKRFRLQLQLADRSEIDPKVIVYCQRVLSEVEFEWISQYWLQGAEHDKMHLWWQGPIRALETMWLSLEEMTFELYQMFLDDAESLPRLALIGFLAELQTRQEQRQQWAERRSDKIYQRRIQASYRPVNRPSFEDTTTTTKRLGNDLGPAIHALLQIRKSLSGRKPHQGNPKESAASPASLNRKRIHSDHQPKNARRKVKHTV